MEDGSDSCSKVDLREYIGFIGRVGNSIGELSPLPGEAIEEIHHALLSAATDLAVELRVWVHEGKVLFFVRHNEVMKEAIGT